MRRFLLSLVLLVASCAPGLVYAQDTTTDNTVYITESTLAVTMCQYYHGGVSVRTFLDDSLFADTALLAETRVHEASHRADFHTLGAKVFCNPKPAVLLAGEVKAYCAEAPLDVKHGHDPKLLFFETQSVLLWQLAGQLPPATVRAAWRAGCGKQLGMN